MKWLTYGPEKPNWIQFYSKVNENDENRIIFPTISKETETYFYRRVKPQYGPIFYTPKIFSESCYSKPNLECNYTFPIDLARIGIPFGAKSIGKV